MHLSLAPSVVGIKRCLALFLTVLSSPIVAGAEQTVDPSVKSFFEIRSKLIAQARESLNRGQVTQGEGHLRAAVVAPRNTTEWHLEYVSLLMAAATHSRERGRLSDSNALYRRAEMEIVKASKTVLSRDASSLADCYYLLGTIARILTGDSPQSESHFEKALELFPSHDAARVALRRSKPGRKILRERFSVSAIAPGKSPAPVVPRR